MAVEHSIRLYFDDDSNFKALRRLHADKTMQPRILDFFITQFAKKDPVFFCCKAGGEVYGLTDVYSSYKLQLKGFHKKQFNLFDRKHSLRLARHGHTVEMSVAKLHVLKWFLANNLLSIYRQKEGMVRKMFYACRKEKRSMRRPPFIRKPIIVKGVRIGR